MRCLTILGAVFASFAVAVSAQCTCTQEALRENSCRNLNDVDCVCGGGYQLSLESCFAFSTECTTRQQNQAINRLDQVCAGGFATSSAVESATESAFPTDTTAASSATDSDTESATPTPTSATDTLSFTPTPSSSLSQTPGPTNAVVVGGGSSSSSSSSGSGSGGSKPGLSKGAIGGVVGAGIAVVAAGVGIAIFILTRRYRKKDAIVAETNAKEVENFIEEGRRKPSAALSASSPSSRAPSGGSYGDRTPLAGGVSRGTRSASGRTFSMDGPVPEESYEEPPSPPQLPPPPISQGNAGWSNFPRPAERSPESQPLTPGAYEQNTQEMHSPMGSFHPAGYY